MQQKASNLSTRESRNTGWSAIASGIIGLISFAALITAVVTRTSIELFGKVLFLFRTHDVGIIVQFILLIPVIVGLYKISQQGSACMSKSMLITGVTALSFVVLFLLLIFPKILADTLYMFPQGVFGIWLISFCVNFQSILSKGLKYFGIVVGIGLALVGIFPLGYPIFVDTIILKIPAVDSANYPPVLSPANNILHIILDIGTLMGVITLPVWTILLGKRILLTKHNIVSS